jgi:uncharacterized protein (TIGR00730 family)
MKKVTVFCASSNQVTENYYSVTSELGRMLAHAGYTVYYGGGKDGLMGRLADTVISQNGRIVGVLPGFMKPFNWFNPNATELIWVNNMAERKQLLLHDSEAVIGLPGGYGTLDELLEVITLKQLGQFLKPVIILNTAGFFDPLLEMFRRMKDENFIREMHLEIWKVVNQPEEVIPAIESGLHWDPAKAALAQL